MTEYKTMDSEGQRHGQILEPKKRSRSMESLVRIENYDTGYDTATPSRSGSIQSIFISEKTDVLGKQVKNQLIEEKSLPGKFHSPNSDKIGKFLKIWFSFLFKIEFSSFWKLFTRVNERLVLKWILLFANNLHFYLANYA